MAIEVPLRKKYLHHSIQQHPAKARTGNSHRGKERFYNTPKPVRKR